MRSCLVRAVRVGAVSVAVVTSAAAQDARRGAVAGSVVTTSGAPLAGALVVLDSGSLGAQRVVTNQQGRFVLRGVTAGRRTIVTRYLGYRPDSAAVDVTPGATAAVTLRLVAAAQQVAGVTVLAGVAQGQARALTQQQTAPNIKSVVAYELFDRFPDRNAAEAVQRVPGVSITRDQGEGEFVQIRGLAPRYNSLAINGQRIPAVEHDVERQVGLDLVQAELMEQIEVTKALTPDMDGDAIGGTVNFVPRQAPDRPALTFAYNGGFNEQQSHFRELGRGLRQGFLVAGGRAAGGRLGGIVSGSYYGTDRGSLLQQLTYDGTTTNITQNRSNDYDVRRRRVGAMGSADYRFDASNVVTLTGSFNSYVDDEIRRRAEFNPVPATERREVRNRREDQTLALGELAGRHALGRASVTWGLFAARTDEDIPNRTSFRFDRANATLRGLASDSVARLDETSRFPSLAAVPFSRVTYSPAWTNEEDYRAYAELSLPFATPRGALTFKAGAKVSDRARALREEQYIARATAGNTTRFPDDRFLFTGFDMTVSDVGAPPASVSALGLRAFERDAATQEAAYDAEERVSAGFAMVTWDPGARLTLLAGARVEHTDNDYRHLRSSRAGSGSYTNVLPSAHLTYRPAPNTNVRLAVSTGLSRPDYSQLVPRNVVNEAERTITRGNPDLSAARAVSGDLLVERFTGALGLLSGGVFAKRLTDTPADRTFAETAGGTQYRVSQPIAGGDASVYGVELAFNQRLAGLGVPLLRRLGVYGNYTFTRSSAEFEGRDLDLPRSPRHTANLALLVDHEPLGFSATVAGNYRSALLLAVGDDAARDTWFDEEFRLDVSATQRVGRGVGVFLRLSNLTDQVEKEVLGEPYGGRTRLQQTEGYGRTVSLGVRYDLGR